MKTSFKPYPGGHFIHQFLDAVLHLRAKHGLDPANVERITCRIADWMIPVFSEPVAAKRRPANDYHANFSMQLSLSASIPFTLLGVEAFSDDNIRNRQILHLADRAEQ